MPASNRESLWFSLIPATWDKAIVAVPGPVTENVPPGPSPRVSAPPSTDPATQGGKDPFGNPVGGDPTLSQLDEGGCNTSGTTSGGAAGTLALFGLVAIAVGLGRDKRRAS